MDAASNQLSAPWRAAKGREFDTRGLRTCGVPSSSGDGQLLSQPASAPCISSHVGVTSRTSRTRPWRGLITEWDLYSAAHDPLAGLFACLLAASLSALQGVAPTCEGAPSGPRGRNLSSQSMLNRGCAEGRAQRRWPVHCRRPAICCNLHGKCPELWVRDRTPSEAWSKIDTQSAGEIDAAALFC